ncbi:MAG: alpha/beta hydrolase [Pseudomonadaceae bacterium]|nr:alpha/beta hydrolase [Pseudomonadaceae bacterium]
MALGVSDGTDAELVQTPGNPCPDNAETLWLEGLGGCRLRTVRWMSGVDQPVGSVLLLHGFSEFIEKYFETAQHLLNRGWHVVTFDWRGQGLSERLNSAVGQRGYVEDFEHFAFDARAVFDQLIEPLPGKRLLMGHSMGGNLALRLLQDHEPRFDAAVVCAPMLGLFRLPLWLARVVSRAYVALGKDADFVWGGAERDFSDTAVNVLTTDAARFARNQSILRACPELATHAPTWRWLREASVSSARVSAKSRARQIDTPTLIVAAECDKVVSIKGYERFAAASEWVRVEQIDGAEHEVLQESDELQAQFWDSFDRFTHQHGN